jgi:predicted nucleic acid-binding protein
LPGSLWRKHRVGTLDAELAATLVSRFALDFAGDHAQPARFAVIAVGPALLDSAAALVGSAGLRAYDSVQLAAAIAARDVVREIDAFACFDIDLRRAAATHGFTLVPATMWTPAEPAQ